LFVKKTSELYISHEIQLVKKEKKINLQEMDKDNLILYNALANTSYYILDNGIVGEFKLV